MLKMTESSLRGEFINLRPLAVSDAEITLFWRKADRARHLNAVNSTLHQQESWISSRPSNELNFIIETKNACPIGMLSLIGIDLVNRHAETGRFLIGNEDAVRGIPAALEAMMLLYELAFNELGLMRIFGSIASGNRLMIKWQKYLGMQEEGRMRSHYFIDGKWQDAVFLGLLADEARTKSIPRMKVMIATARKNSLS